MRAFARKPGLCALWLCLGLGTAQAAPDMVVVGYGGAGQKAQDVAFFQPFSAQDKSKLIQSEYGDECRILGRPWR